MTLVSIVLWMVGVVLIALGYQRAKAPWSRYQAMKEQDSNASRYNAWRGGIRDDPSTSGASVAMAILRRQAQIGGAIAIAGFVLVLLGFLIK
ncbi:MAG TPA: hypothetical protein VM427_10915 [Patescibacteria group bacterium]|nr:hypothetical protein [Patescibacteria group bacterium]